MARSTSPVERKAGDHAQHRRVAGGEEAPPRFAIALAGHRQHAERRASVGDGTQHLAGRAEGGHPGMAAVMIARQVPKAGRLVRGADGDLQIDLDGEAAGQEFAPKTHQDRLREGSAMPGQQPAQDLRLAPGAQRRRRVLPFQLRDVLDHGRPRHQDVVQRVVEFVDAAAQIGKRWRSGRHGHRIPKNRGRV
jgi:hypothetical protein